MVVSKIYSNGEVKWKIKGFIFQISSIIVLCDKTKGIALLKADEIEDLADKVFQK